MQVISSDMTSLTNRIRLQAPPSGTSRLAVALICLLPMAEAALPHDSWISRESYKDPHTNAWCCDERDCVALDNGVVSAGGTGGFIVDNKYYVPRARVLPSGDGRYWACFNEEGTGPHDRPRGVRCFFAPMFTTRQEAGGQG